MNYQDQLKLWTRRRDLIYKAWKAGQSMREIAYQYGLSVQRVQQIVATQRSKR